MALIAVVIGGLLFLAGQVLVQSCACTTAPDPARDAGGVGGPIGLSVGQHSPP